MNGDSDIVGVHIWKSHAELFAAKNDALVRHARVLMDSYRLPEDLAEDVVQDAWADLIPRWDGIRFPLAWMYAVVDKKAARQAERSQRQAVIGIETASQHAAWTSRPPSVSVETMVTVHAAIREIAALPHQQRVALYLRAIEGHEYADIADLMRIGKGTVGNHLHKARKTLLARLGYLGTAVMVLATAVGATWHPLHSGSDQKDAEDGGRPGGAPASESSPDFTWNNLAALQHAAEEAQRGIAGEQTLPGNGRFSLGDLAAAQYQAQGHDHSLEPLLSSSPDVYPEQTAALGGTARRKILDFMEQQRAEILSRERAAQELLDALTRPGDAYVRA